MSIYISAKHTSFTIFSYIAQKTKKASEEAFSAVELFVKVLENTIKNKFLIKNTLLADFLREAEYVYLFSSEDGKNEFIFGIKKGFLRSLFYVRFNYAP